MTYPTADQVAIAVVEACRSAGGSPLKCVEASVGNMPRARYIAMHALVAAFPDCRIPAICRMVGFRGKFDETLMRAYENSKTGIDAGIIRWWRPEVAARIASVLKDELPPKFWMVDQVSTRRPVRPSAPAVGLMGDPPPGRSALDRIRK